MIFRSRLVASRIMMLRRLYLRMRTVNRRSFLILTLVRMRVMRVTRWSGYWLLWLRAMLIMVRLSRLMLLVRLMRPWVRLAVLFSILACIKLACRFLRVSGGLFLLTFWVMRFLWSRACVAFRLWILWRLRRSSTMVLSCRLLRCLIMFRWLTL